MQAGNRFELEKDEKLIHGDKVSKEELEKYNITYNGKDISDKVQALVILEKEETKDE